MTVVNKRFTHEVYLINTFAEEHHPEASESKSAKENIRNGGQECRRIFVYGVSYDGRVI